MKIKSLLNKRFIIRNGIKEFIFSHVSQNRLGVVVDIGSGKSPYRSFIDCEKYLALDCENRTNNQDVIIADINSYIPLPSESVDLVLMTEVIEHIYSPDRAILEIWRILKPGGILLLTTPFVWPIHEKPNDFQRFTSFGIASLAKRNNFSSCTVSPYGNWGLILLQMAMFNMRSRVYLPIVFALNVFSLPLKNKHSEIIYLSNHVKMVK